MRFSNIVRILVYSATAIALAAVALLGLSIYLRGIVVPDSVLQNNFARQLVSRYGIQLNLQSLRIGCLTKTCPAEVNAGALEIEVQTPEPLRIRLNDSYWSREDLFKATGLEVQSAERQPLFVAENLEADLQTRRVTVNGIKAGLLPQSPPSEIGTVVFDGTRKEVTARGIRFASSSIDSLELQGWSPAPENILSMDRITIAGVHVNPTERTPSNKTICEQLPSAGELGSEALAPLRPLLPLLLSDVQLMKRDLLRIAFVGALAVLILKLVTTLWMRNLPVLLLLSAVPAALPFLFHFQFRQSLLVSMVAIAGIALLLRIFVYRRGERWYHRWEPFVVDLVSIAVLLPLAGFGFELPPFPPTPEGVRINSIDIANIDAQPASPTRIRIPETSIRNVFIALPGADPQIELEVGSIEIPGTRITGDPSSRVALDGLRIDGVNVLYNPETREVGNIAAHVRLAGMFESDALAKELRNLEYLRGIDLRSRVDFDADVQASGPATAAKPSTQFPTSKRLIAANAAITLRPAECTLGFDVATRIQTPQLRMTALADGNLEAIRIRSLRSLPGSPIQIAAGSGSVKLAGTPQADFNLESIAGNFDSTQLDIASIGITASIPARGKAGVQTATLSLGPTRIRPVSGWDIHIARSSMHVDRMPDKISVPITSETRIQDLQMQGPGGRIEASLPSLAAWISGQASPEPIPNHFNGTIGFAASGTNTYDELFGADQPIAFDADLWKGLFDVPEQNVVFRSAMLSEERTELPIQLKLAGRLSSLVPRLNADIEGRAALPLFEYELGSGKATIADTRISGRMNWDDQGSTAGITYGIGSARIPFSSGPSAICLNAISTLDVSTTGTLSRLPERMGAPLAQASASAPLPCVSLPPIPESVQFQIAGNFPVGSGESLVRLEREDGTGIRIRAIESVVDRLLIRDGRFANIETRMDVSAIGSLQGGAEIDIQTNLRNSKDSLELKSGIFTPEGTRLLDAQIVSTPNRLALDATQHVPADRLIAQIQPLLSDLQIDFGNVNPQARLTHFHAEAEIENGEMLNAAVLARLDSGALVSIDSPELQSKIGTPSSTASPEFTLKIGPAATAGGPRPIVASANVTGLHVGAVTDKQVTIAADADLGVTAQGTLYMSGRPSASPVLERTFQVSNGLTRQISSLATLVETPPESKSEPLTVKDVRWKIHLSQDSTQSDLLRMAADSLEIHVADADIDASWNSSASPDRSRIAVSSALDSSISLHGNELLLDLHFPTALQYSFNGEPESQFDFNLPIQAAFSEKLMQAAENSATLWNEDYYRQFWGTHPPKFTGSPFVSPIDFNEVMLGTLSVREIRFPLEPIRAVIGYADALEVGVPFSGRALYGMVNVNFESRVATKNDSVTLDTRMNLALRNLQAGAIGATMSGGHSAFVEDELDGKISVRVDRLTLDRTTIPAMRSGRVSGDDLETLGVSAHFSRSRESAGIPGVFQASSDVQINLVNEVLNQIVKDLRLPAPPRALTYRDLALNFDVDRGRVRTDSEVFKLSGVQLFSSNTADVSAEVRAHLGRPGERIMLESLIEMLGSFTSGTNTGGR